MSSDYGADWTDLTTSGSQNWWAVSTSSNGAVIVAGVWHGDIYTSTDYGATWTDDTAAGSHGWYASAISSDGSRSVVADGDGSIRYNGPGGDIWTADDPSLAPSTPSAPTQPSAPSAPGAPDTGIGSPAGNPLEAFIEFNIFALSLVGLAFGTRKLVKPRG